MAENFQGIRQFTAPELAYLQQVQEERRDWLAQRGIRYIFVVAPDKQTIYPENLPSWLKPTGRPTKLDQFMAHMHAHSTVAVPDLRPALREAKSTAPTYFQTDSHWNLFGGFIASREIVKLLPEKLDPEPLTLDSFELKTVATEQGDMANMLGVFAHEVDPTLAPKTNLPPLVQTVEHPDYVVQTYFTSNAWAHGSCVVFRDSFGPALKPYLGYHFKTVSYFWVPGGFDTNIIADIKPDVVISEIVERHFNEPAK